MKLPLARIALVGGPLAAFGIAFGTSEVREQLGIANVALLLAAVVTLAATTSWVAGLATSVVAAPSLNYFHTQPVHSLRINATSDLIAVLLLATIGLGVSAATAVRSRRLAVVRSSARSADAVVLLRESMTTKRPLLDVWDAAIDAASAQLGLIDVRLEPSGSGHLPVIARRWVEPVDPKLDHTMLLPEGGAVVRFLDPSQRDQLVLTPRQGMGAVEVDRRVALSFADQVDLALHRN